MAVTGANRKIPENLGRLDENERAVREHSIAAIHGDVGLLDHVELIEAVMDHLDFFAKRHAVDLDQETVQFLGARVFNDLASAYGQVTCGYYQIAAAVLRDVMEILYLLGLFDRDSAKISEWRASDDAARRRIFAPVKVRKFLDDFDGFMEGKRDKAYKMFCEYAAHATWQGFVLLRPTGGGQVIMGPFFGVGLMKAVLEEMAQLAAQIGNYFSGFFPKDHDVQALETSLRRLEVTGKWAEKYLGRKHDAAFIDEMKAQLSVLRR
jgi:hypothetical protein